MDREHLDTQVDLLLSKNSKAGCDAMNVLENISRESNVVYPYMYRFFDMLESDNSYVRTRALVLIAANAKWDVDYKIDEVIDKYLRHITDAKPITARQCVKLLPDIAKYKPDLKKDVISALQNANISFYADSMRPLLRKDLDGALEQINRQ